MSNFDNLNDQTTLSTTTPSKSIKIKKLKTISPSLIEDKKILLNNEIKNTKKINSNSSKYHQKIKEKTDLIDDAWDLLK